MFGVGVDRIDRVVLIGFSGTGKSTIATMLADLLGWAAIDIDAEIERDWNKSIPAIFRENGETAFRERERSILGRAIQARQAVIATGGGVPAQPGAWEPGLLGNPNTLVVAVDALPSTLLERLQNQAEAEGEAVERPMLEGPNPLRRIVELKQDRQSAYDAAHLTISTEGVVPASVATELASVVKLMNGTALHHRLEAPSGASDIFVGSGSIARLGDLARQRWTSAGKAWVVTDDRVGPLHGEAVSQALRDGGFAVSSMSVAHGEGSKSLGTLGAVYDWMLGAGIERGHIVVALGGGVIGDLVGFAAATVLRGVGFVQAPTTLLAAVDSSIGGKTGVNHAAGKNLIGAFLQPPLVVVDPNLLRTVPDRELRSGWGEVVKHAMIQRTTPGGSRNDLTALLSRNSQQLSDLEDPALSYAIWRNIRLKGAVVEADEREAGIRAFLNFGHTLGHAIEASDYQLLHGEAVAVGMRAESLLGAKVNTCTLEDVGQLTALVRQFCLPVAAAFDRREVLARMGSDKKRVAGRQRFVLPLSGGGVTIRDDVPTAAVEAALDEVAMADAAP